MLVTEFGIVTDDKPEHCAKALLPILVTEFGIVTDAKPTHSPKALSPMLVTESGVPLHVICAGIVIAPVIPLFCVTLAVVGDVKV